MPGGGLLVRTPVDGLLVAKPGRLPPCRRPYDNLATRFPSRLSRICAFPTDETEAPLFRLAVEPNQRNGLRAACRLMADKITTVPKTKIGARVGRLDDEDILRLNQAVLVFLGLAVSPRIKREA